ncbi:hypothetical protein [Sandarakinorhabdus sp. DWP1-3-1]|uniref:hypothetical protein n=1 Tax=Sandarakinorhabdus sp. DWP1-3-1 TaxID=2804627 RepID=UPI003CFAC783
MHSKTVPPLSLIVGSSLTAVVACEFDWAFDFTGGFNIVAESSHWRLRREHRVIITDEDHGQIFGHKAPVDAGAVVRGQLQEAAITGAELSIVSDLLPSFAGGCVLELLVSSSGYENWHVYGHDSSHTCATGGGEVCQLG